MFLKFLYYSITSTNCTNKIEITEKGYTYQCRIHSYFEAGIPAWDPELKPLNSQKC